MNLYNYSAKSTENISAKYLIKASLFIFSTLQLCRTPLPGNDTQPTSKITNSESSAPSIA